MTFKNRKVTIPVSIGYGLTDIMGGGAFTVIGAWLLFFYTTFVGLSPIEAASIVAIARIVDAIVSLFMGSFTDHFYKHYLGKKFGIHPAVAQRDELLVLSCGVPGLRDYRRDGADPVGDPAVRDDQRL